MFKHMRSDTHNQLFTGNLQRRQEYEAVGQTG